MEETTPIRAVEMVRDIRDQLASEWADKSPAELIQILNHAGVQARDEARRERRDSTSNELRILVARSRDKILGWTKSGHGPCYWSLNGGTTSEVAVLPG